MVSLGVIIGAYILVCIAVIAVLVLGPNRDQRDSVLGRAFRCVSKVPTVAGLGCCLLLSCGNLRRAETRWVSCEERSFHRKNPALLCFYMALVWTVEGLYLWYVAPTLAPPHMIFGFAMVFLGEYYFIRAWWCDPGIVTPAELAEEAEESARGADEQPDDTTDAREANTKNKNKKKEVSSLCAAEEHRQNCRYDFDGLMYACAAGNGYGDTSTGLECYSCHVPRPSRSKHCSMCGRCVRRFDHHCPWINNDVGEGSLRYFIYFVFWHVVSCFKGGYDCVAHCAAFLERQRVWRSYFVNGRGERETPSWGIVAMYLLQNKMVVACVALFAILVGFMLLWFLYHHVSMMARNVTTNDEAKIDVIMEYVELLHNYAVNREELGKMRARAATEPELLLEREEKLARTLRNLEAHPPTFMDPRAATRLRAEIFGLNLGGAGVAAKEHRRRRAEAAKAFKKEIYKTFCLGSVWANISDSMWPYGGRPTRRNAQTSTGFAKSCAKTLSQPSSQPSASKRPSKKNAKK